MAKTHSNRRTISPTQRGGSKGVGWQRGGSNARQTSRGRVCPGEGSSRFAPACLHVHMRPGPDHLASKFSPSASLLPGGGRRIDPWSGNQDLTCRGATEPAHSN